MAGPFSPEHVKLAGLDLMVIPDPGAASQDADPAYTGEYLALDSTKTLERRDVPLDHLNTFQRGAYFLRRHDERDDGGYAWAENLYTHDENGVSLSGKLVGSTEAVITGLTNGAILDTAVFNGHLWAITARGRVIRFPSADPTGGSGAFVLDPALNAFGIATESLGTAGGDIYRCKAICVFATAAGAPALYVSAYNVTTGGTRLYEYVTAGGGTWRESTTASPGSNMGFRLDRLVTVWWEAIDGVASQFMVGQTDDSTLMVCKLGSDPLVPASWVSAVYVGNPGYPITALVAAPQHVLPIKSNGIHTFNAIRSMNLTPEWEDTVSYNVGRVAKIYDKALYVARGFGMTRLPLNNLGVVEDGPLECGPGYAAQDGSPVRGQITALSTHNGYLLMALWNPETLTSYLGRARMKSALGLPQDNDNPLAHYWAEQVILPSTSVLGHQVTHMRVIAPIVSSGVTVPQRKLWHWIFTAATGASGTSAGYGTQLLYAPLPIGSGPLSFQASQTAAGTAYTYAFNATGKLIFTQQQWGDDLATKYLRVIEMLAQNITKVSNNSIQIKTRVNTDPTTITDDTTWVSAGIISAANETAITPATEVSAKLIGLQAILTMSTSTTNPPILQAISPRAKVVRPVSNVRYLHVVLEKNHKLSGNRGISPQSADATWTAIVALQDVGKQAFIDENGDTTNVLVEQGIQYQKARVRINGKVTWRTVAKVTLSGVA